MRTERILPFADFLKSIQNSSSSAYLNSRYSHIKSQYHFKKMREYLLNLYEGVTSVHSYVDNEQIWDCIPIMAQPSLRGVQMSIAEPPDLRKRIHYQDGFEIENTFPHYKPESLDPEGNAIACPTGHIPFRRITLEEMSKFSTLRLFLNRKANYQKSLLTSPQRRYAHAYQLVDNRGGHGLLNIWKPRIHNDDIFSLCQHWYTSGRYTPFQSIETGWQVWPQKYGTAMPCLFIYWTHNGYKPNTGYYNNEGPGFIQTNHKWALGGAFPDISIPNGKQFDLEVAWHLHDENWWLFLNGAGPSNAVGYYPASIFKNGPLSHAAYLIDYGGETVSSKPSCEMGSGEFASTGYKHAAYLRNIFYFSMDGKPHEPQLNPITTSPGCYTIEMHKDDLWGSYFYFGGPGGNGC